MTMDRTSESELLRTGSCAGFRVLETKIDPSVDGETALVTIELVFGESEEDDPDEIVEWAAHGFMFCLACLSFLDARPRGHSEIDFDKSDEFRLSDFVEGLSFESGKLCFKADYLRGRCLKTEIEVSSNGHIALETRSRGKQAVFWLDRLQGKKPMGLV